MRRRRNQKGANEDECVAVASDKSEGSPFPYPPNSALETALYWTCYLGVYAYAAYSLSVASKEYRSVLSNSSFAPGWWILGGEKDIANMEWTFYREWADKIWPWFFGHVIVGKATSAVFPKARSYVFLLYSIVALSFIIGWRAVLVQITHCTISYIVATTTRAALLVWFADIALLSSLNFDTFAVPLKELFDIDPDGNKYYFIVFTTALLNIRFTSFGLEACQKPKPGGEVLPSRGYLDMLIYCFYFPLFICGPIITFEKFDYQINQPSKPWNVQRVRSYILTASRLMFWFAFYELTAHFFYVDAIARNIHILRTCNIWVLAGVGILCAQYFMVKYVIIFGTTSLFAKLDDFDTPEQPQCVAYIYLYSHLWKFFDRGLYSFLKRYIYVPLGGSTHGVIRQQVASFACFIFVCYFHGADYYLLVWILVSFTGMTLEGVRSYIISKLRERNPMASVMERRLTSFFSIPFLWFGTYGCLYFLVGAAGGYVYIHRTFNDKLVTLMVCLTHYSQIQVSTDIERWKAANKIL